MKKLAEWVWCVAVVACASGCIPIGIRGTTMAAAETARSAATIAAKASAVVSASDASPLAVAAQRPESA